MTQKLLTTDEMADVCVEALRDALRLLDQPLRDRVVARVMTRVVLTVTLAPDYRVIQTPHKPDTRYYSDLSWLVLQKLGAIDGKQG